MTTVATTNPQEAKQVSNPQDAKTANTAENPQEIRSSSKLESTKITDSLGIGMDPTFPLHVALGKTVRFEMGDKTAFSLGAPGTVCVDKRDVPGGRLIIQDNGNVGINQPDPKATLDVNGTIQATTVNFTGELVVKGMKPHPQAPLPSRLRDVYFDPQTGTLYYQQL